MKKGVKKKRTKAVKPRRTIRKKSVSKRRPAGKLPKRSSKKAAPVKKPFPLDLIGRVTHYFPKVKAGVIKITKGILTVGEEIHIKGHTTDFKQRVNSIQLDRVPLKRAGKGQEVGLRVRSRVRQNDGVYRSG